VATAARAASGVREFESWSSTQSVPAFSLQIEIEREDEAKQLTLLQRYSSVDHRHVRGSEGVIITIAIVLFGSYLIYELPSDRWL